FAPPAAEAAEHEDVAEAPDRSESLAASGAGAGAGIVPDSLAAASARAAEDRDAAGAAHGAGIVPPREAGTEQPGYEAATDLPEHEAGTDEPEHEAATDLPETEEITAHGAGIVPPRAASADEVQDDETPAPSIQDAIGARGTDREEAPVTWRDLWGFRRDSGSTEEK
ncbi:MAG TPA: hypothetical protein GX743_03335, partial [Actinomycetales bacterium]|nr:hypothetical protein [Actinomycetales bacterium]